jgi:hypothetical protein
LYGGQLTGQRGDKAALARRLSLGRASLGEVLARDEQRRDKIRADAAAARANAD